MALPPTPNHQPKPPVLSLLNPRIIGKNTRETNSFFCETGCGPFHVCSRVPRSWRLLLVFNGQGSRAGGRADSAQLVAFGDPTWCNILIRELSACLPMGLMVGIYSLSRCTLRILSLHMNAAYPCHIPGMLRQVSFLLSLYLCNALPLVRMVVPWHDWSMPGSFRLQ